MKSYAPQLPCAHRYETKLHSRITNTLQRHNLRLSPLGTCRSHCRAHTATLRLSAAKKAHETRSQAAAHPAVDRACAASTTERQPSDSGASAAEQLTQRLVWASAALTLASFAPDLIAGAGGAPPQVVGSGWPPWLVRAHQPGWAPSAHQDTTSSHDAAHTCATHQV